MNLPGGVARVWEYLGELGWPHDLDGRNGIMTEYEGHFGQVKVRLQVHDSGIQIGINPVLSKPSGARGLGDSVSRLIAALNDESKMIQVGLDEQGEVFVKVDILNEGLEFEKFVYVLFSLCQVSEQLMLPVLQAQAYDSLPGQVC